MKKILLTLTALAALQVGAQTLQNKKDGGIQFTVIRDLEKNQVDNQYRSSTCWSFSSLSFFESELLRMGKGKHNLSEMFVVNHTYRDKAAKYVRMQGTVNFGPGGAFHDALYVMKNYGMVPEEVYGGKKVDAKNHIHGEMDEVLKAMVQAVVKNPNGKISSAWKDAFAGAIDGYLGALPEKFTYNKKEYNPKSYLESLGLNPDDYVVVTSFKHHPYYESFVLEVPDNWAAQTCYNVPLADFQKIMENSITNGYSFAWAADVSEKGFNWTNGVAVVPENGWEDVPKTQVDSLTNHPIKQMTITQENRQAAFDSQETQDDHGMHITGMVKDQNGTKYYIVKNSWGVKGNDCDGYMYASEAYVLYKTTNIMLHKSALPGDISKKLNIR